MTDKHELTPLWEVFIRPRNGLHHRHVGSLHAADSALALQSARDVYTRPRRRQLDLGGPLVRYRRLRSVLCRTEFRARRRQDLSPPEFLRHSRRRGAHVMASAETAVPAILEIADDCLILGHRLSEWCGHAPILEEELALANMGLDLLGQAQRALCCTPASSRARAGARMTSPSCAANATI